ncbi:MAG: hypothetical protein ACLRZ9_12990 [Eubacterium sp.]
MFTNGAITHFEKKNAYKSQSYDVYLEQNSSSKDSKEGRAKSWALFVSVPTDKEIPFNEGDLIVVGKCTFEFDISTEKAESDSYSTLKNNHRVFTVKSVDPCLYGSKAIWHYELGCD